MKDGLATTDFAHEPLSRSQTRDGANYRAASSNVRLELAAVMIDSMPRRHRRRLFAPEACPKLQTALHNRERLKAQPPLSKRKATKKMDPADDKPQPLSLRYQEPPCATSESCANTTGHPTQAQKKVCDGARLTDRSQSRSLLGK